MGMKSLSKGLARVIQVYIIHNWDNWGYKLLLTSMPLFWFFETEFLYVAVLELTQ